MGRRKSAAARMVSPARTPRPPLYDGMLFSRAISIEKYATKRFVLLESVVIDLSVSRGAAAARLRRNRAQLNQLLSKKRRGQSTAGAEMLRGCFQSRAAAPALHAARGRATRKCFSCRQAHCFLVWFGGSRARRWRRPAKQFYVLLIKFLLVEIHLHVNERFPHVRLVSGSPGVRVAVGRAVIHFDVDIKFLPLRDDGRIQPGDGGEFIPQDIRFSVFCDI